MGISLSSIGHAFATAFHDVKVAAIAVENFVAKNGGTIQHDLEVVAGVSAFIPGVGPIAAAIARGGEAVLGAVSETINDVKKDLVKDNGDSVTMTITLAKDVYADLLKIVPAVKSAVALPATTTPVPAGPNPSVPVAAH